MGGGVYAPDSSQLHAIREHIAAHHEQLDAIVGTARFKRLGGLQGERMSRIPRGYVKDHPAGHYLQYKQFLGIREERPEFATHADFYTHLLDTFTSLVPLCRFLNKPLVARTHSRFDLSDSSSGPQASRRTAR
jgi:uncharacterized protein (DUF2461 family)